MPQPKKKKVLLPARRPAETAGGIVGLATAIAALLGASVETVAVVGLAAGFIPAITTWIVDNEGLIPAIKKILGTGKKQDGFGAVEVLVIILVVLGIIYLAQRI